MLDLMRMPAITRIQDAAKEALFTRYIEALPQVTCSEAVVESRVELVSSQAAHCGTCIHAWQTDTIPLHQGTPASTQCPSCITWCYELQSMDCR